VLTMLAFFACQQALTSWLPFTTILCECGFELSQSLKSAASLSL
jgi:hypothetical protein